MAEFLSIFDAEGPLLLMAVIGGLLFFLLLAAGEYWHRIRLAEIAAKLKLEMLDRGMSADEIKTVLEAGPKK